MSFYSIAVKERTYTLLKKLRVRMATEMEGNVPSYDEVLYHLLREAGEIQ